MSDRWIAALVAVCMLASWVELSAQDRLKFTESIGEVAQAQDTASTETEKPALPADSSDLVLRLRINAGYQLAPMHAYFRDEYRPIQDMRRLVLFVDPNAIFGLESVPELVEIGRKFPESKQTEIIGVAAAGAVANYFSEIVSKQLRKRNLRFIQWELEKVVLRGASRYVNANLYNGMRIKGMSFQIPALRMSFSRHANRSRFYDGFTFLLTRRLGFHFVRYQKRDSMGPMLFSKLGTAVFNYEPNRRIAITSYDFRRGMSAIIRIVHINYLTIPVADEMRCEVMMRW